MLLIKASVGNSRVHGMGLFARQQIAKGTIIWRFTPKLDVIITKDEMSLLRGGQQVFVRCYAYLNKKTDCYTLCCDDARFFNHSETPNTVSVEVADDSEGLDVALRDIEEGEELTCSYDEFDAEATLKLARVAPISPQK